ncbi:MAG: sigma 54-interacting transcriptional regulator [Pseudomonadota bacterium]
MRSDDPEDTLTSQLSSLEEASGRLLALTILWHPQLERVGQQCIAGPGAGEIALNRFAPLFARPGGVQLPLGERCIARDRLWLRRGPGDALAIDPPQSRMSVELDGVALTGPTMLAPERIDGGLVLALGGAVLLCIHWADGLPRATADNGLLGVSSAMRKVHELIGQVAATELPVLVLGETGTGKELAARAIHAASARRVGPFAAVNMAALNESLAAADLFGATRGAYTGAQSARGGLFAEAADGTLFLDEIGNAPAPVQPMLLRVLETGEYRPLGAAADAVSRARVISATDQDLGAAGFNQPLRRRLEAFVICMPALRQRREDIGLLIVHVQSTWGAGATPVQLPAALVGAMCAYHWPGNVRQLHHVVTRALMAVQAGQAPSLAALLPRDAPAPAPAENAQRQDSLALPAAPHRTRLADVDDTAVLAAMARNGWQIRSAAQELGVSRPSMYKLIEAHPQIRVASAIPLAELRAALATHGADVARCAAALRTPSEALRRLLRGQGLIS